VSWQRFGADAGSRTNTTQEEKTMNTAPHPVVVGISSKQATVVSYALAEAARLKTSLRVVHCYALPAQAAEFYVGGDVLDTFRIAGETVIEDARQLIEDEGAQVEVAYVLANGLPGAVLLAESMDAQAIVLGADDIPWYDRMVGGEVSGHLARKAACPVLVVPEVDQLSDQRGGVVVTIDGDTSALSPLRYGFEQADIRGETLHVLHAAPAATLQDDFDNHRANVAEILAGWAELYPDVRVLSSLTSGDPVETCLAATEHASLVVIGRPHSHTVVFALARPLAMQVLRQAHCPVAVVASDYRGA
jgi:nucleotide-binding universal stress UspA family protein